MEYDSTNRGSLFKNEKKTEDRHPDLSGSININGKDYWISGWSKVSKGGQKFISLSVREKQEMTRQIDKPTTKAKAEDFNDPIPW
jgi:uncharacterized protein (DUF736 family)